MRHLLSFESVALGVALAIGAAAPAMAQQAGSWSVSVGGTHLAPQVSSGNLSAPSLPSTQASVSSDTKPTAVVSYMLTDNVGLSLPMGMGFKHTISGAGAIAGVGTLATTKALPVTLLGQYRFMPAQAPLRPYVGVGLTYAKFYDTQGTGVLTALTNPGGAATTMSLQSKFAPTLQIGATLNPAPNSRWFIDAHVTKSFLSTNATLSTGQSMSMKLDPLTFTLGVGYRF